MAPTQIERNLMDQLAEAREQIRQLQALLAPAETVRRVGGVYLSRGEALMLTQLRSGETLDKGKLRAAMDARRPEREGGELSSVPVMICRLRRKLAPIGVTIRTDWGRGFFIDAQSRMVLNDATVG